MKLFLKGAKCFSDKCPIEKRNFAPGQHGKDRKAKVVGYGLQLQTPVTAGITSASCSWQKTCCGPAR